MLGSKVDEEDPKALLLVAFTHKCPEFVHMLLVSLENLEFFHMVSLLLSEEKHMEVNMFVKVAYATSKGWKKSLAKKLSKGKEGMRCSYCGKDVNEERFCNWKSHDSKKKEGKPCTTED